MHINMLHSDSQYLNYFCYLSCLDIQCQTTMNYVHMYIHGNNTKLQNWNYNKILTELQHTADCLYRYQ
jgi:hypothetical protein